MASLKRWINDRAKQAQGAYHQVNMLDGGRTYDTNQRGVVAGTPNPINVKNDNTRGFQLSNNSLTRGASRAFDQANPLDSGRTWKQRTPAKLDMSVLDQARKNGATNLIGNSFIKPLVRTSMAYSQAAGNLGTMAAGGKSQNANQFYGKKATNLTGYTGTKQQIAGDAVTNVANIAMPGSSTIVKGAFKSVAPKFVPNVVNRAVANAGVGAVGGGVSNLGAELSNDQIKSFKDARGAVTAGAQFGAAIGAGGTLALPVVKAGARGTQRSAQIAKELPAKQNERLESAIIKRDPELNERVTVTRASLQNQYDKGSSVQRKQVERAIAENEQAIRDRINKTKQGGYARIPSGKKDPAPDLSPKQKEFVNDYAEMLEGMDAGNGVSLVPDGEAYGYGKMRQSSNSPTYKKLYEANGGKPSKEQWFNEAREQIESGKAGFGASDDFKTLPKLSPADVGATPNSGRKAVGQAELAASSSTNIQPIQVGRQTKANRSLPKMPEVPETVLGRKDVPSFGPNVKLPRKSEEIRQLQQPSSQLPLKDQTFDPIIPQLPESRLKTVSGKDRKTGAVGALQAKKDVVDRLSKSTRSIIEHQGESGKQLAGMLQGARDTEEMFIASIQKAMPNVTKIARKGQGSPMINKDFENFVEAAQGLAEPRNARVAQAVDEWRTNHPAIRQRAVDAGLDVGDLGPNYYPHFIDYDRIFKDKNTYNESLNHLVKTGQAQSAEEAIKLLSFARDVSRNRQFGNLEASRLVDLPFYDKTPNSFISYLSGSAKRIANTETFGKDDQEALKLIARAGQEGYDTEVMKNAFDVAVGAKQYNPTTANASRIARQYITTTRLGQGALTNISQNVNTGVVTGHMRTLAAAVKQLDPRTREFVGETGVIADAVLNAIKTQAGYSSFGQRLAGKAVNKITAPGFGTVEKLNRSIAATAGRDYANRLAKRGKDDTLRKLGVTGEIKNGVLTEAQQIQAARKIVEKTQFKVDPQDLPGWTDSPGGKLVAQFRTFSYNQSKFISNEVIKPAAKGNFVPLARLLAAMPVGYGLYESRRILNNQPEEENKTKQVLGSFQKIGGAGIVFDLYQSFNPIGSKYIPTDRRQSMAVGAIGGPAVGVATQAVGALSETIQKKNTPDDESKLEGKVVAQKNENDYRDLTALARFGLQQIPVVGTPIKNKLLPYKKESDSAAGKVTGNEKLDSALQAKEDRNESFKKSLSKEDYKIYQLSKEDKKKLVNDNVVSQEKLDGLENYAQNKRKELGFDDKKDLELPDGMNNYDVQTIERFSNATPEEKDNIIRSEKDAEYKLAVAEYERDKKQGKISRVEEMKRDKDIKRHKAGKDYTKDIREFYTLNKGEIFDYISDNEDGSKVAKKLLAYDDALVEEGAQVKNKFRDKYGNPDFDPSSARSAKSRKGKGKGKKAVPSDLLAKAVNIPSVGRARKAQFSVSAPARGNLKRSSRKAIPKISTRPKTLAVRRTA